MFLSPESITKPLLIQAGFVVGTILTIVYVYRRFLRERSFHPDFPVVRLTENGDTAREWLTDMKSILDKGMRLTDGPFQVTSAFGPLILLPTRFAAELRKDSRLSLTKAVQQAFFTGYPGFEGFVPDLTGTWIKDVVQGRLTQSLNLITHDLVDEADLAITEQFPASKEWRTFEVKKDNLQIVARLSARVFLGFPLCRDQSWLEISKNYTVSAFTAASKLRRVPWYLRSLASRFWIPECAQIQREMADARILLREEVNKRQAKEDRSLAGEKGGSERNNSIDWMIESAKKKGIIEGDIAAGQVTLALGAIHTTAESVVRSLLDCCVYPEIVGPLREEIISVLKENGWTKVTLYKLCLMDSFLKESQRLRPGQWINFQRMVTDEIQLSNGVILPKGSVIDILPGFNDSTVFRDPEKFDVRRFLDMRNEPGQENLWNFVTAHPSHMGFGYGEHICPGRFFATNEVKISLCFLLLRYDWQLDQEGPAMMQPEDGASIRPDLKLRYKSRTPELDLMSLIDKAELDSMRAYSA